MTTARVLGLAICLASVPAFALEQGEYRFNGFGTAGLTYLGGEADSKGYGVNGQTTDSWRPEQLSKLGGQFQYGITDTIGFTAQATVKAAQDEWQGNMEWLYLSWQASDNLVLRGGRLRTPVYMYSESIDVGFSYPWLRLPDEVYSQVQLSNYEGADAVYTLPTAIGSVAFQIAAGQAKDREIFALDDMHDIDYNTLFGANVSLATNDFGTFRISYTEANPKTNIQDDFTLLGVNVQDYSFSKWDEPKGKFTSLGYQYDNGTWLGAGEWTSRVVENDGLDSTDAFYLMGGRRFGEVLAHITYAQLDEDSGRQNSWTYGLNYNLLPTVVLKGEYKRVETSGNSYKGVFVRNAQQTVDDLNGLTAAHNPDGDIFSVGVDFVF